jgi:hypothetical protein
LPYQLFRARQYFAEPFVSGFTILSIDFKYAGQRESFRAVYGASSCGGLPAAITEFLTTLPSEVEIQTVASRSIWMPVDGDSVVSGQISGLAKVGRSTWIFSFVAAFRFGLPILNESWKIARTNLPGSSRPG